MRTFFDWLVYQQDYLWFLAVLGWLAVGVAWWRAGRNEADFAWVPWAALFSTAMASVEMSQLVTPLVLKPFVVPWLAWDLALGWVQAALAIGLGWTWVRRAGWKPWAVTPIFVLAAGAAWSRMDQPLPGTIGLVTLNLALTLAVIRVLRVRGYVLVGLLALVGAVVFATNGPLTEWLRPSRRYTGISAWALLTASCLLGGAVATGWALFQRRRGAPDEAERRELGQLWRAQAGWLLVGIGLAVAMSHWARAAFENNLRTRALMAAELIDTRYLATALGPHFRVEARYADEFMDKLLTTYSSRSFRPEFTKTSPLPDELAKIERANPDINWASIVTVRDGWHVIFELSSLQPPSIYPDQRPLYGPATEELTRAWQKPEPHVLAPVRFFYGTVAQARGPLVSPEGEMLGWVALDVGVAGWLAAQVQARLLAFLVIALGSGLLALNWRQRQRDRLNAVTRREAETARAANALKTAFLAKVSHELRTPIQSLLGYSELLRERLATDPKASGWLASLQQHGELMTRLVNDLIDLSAVEAGAFQLAPKPSSPADILQQTLDSLRPRADAKHLELACFIEPGVPARAMIDAERFRQVAINLVSNAVKFTEYGGVTVLLRPDGDHLQLVVTDTGPGIPPEDQARLFVAFSRLELTAEKEGSGLGLALSAALCQAMGGTLRVESDGRTGARFTATFTAPAIASTETVKLTTDDAPTVSLRGYRVLVVDDNPLVRELFVAFLTEQGALCAAAATGREARAQAAAGPFDAIVLDLALPDGDGTEFVDPLRAALPLVRIIGVSAHAGAFDRGRALAAGMQVFLSKPVVLAELARAVAPHQVVVGSDAGPRFATAEALRERLARQFRAEAAQERARLAELVAAGDWTGLRRAAHVLKNSAIVVRDDRLFTVCNALEQAALRGDEAAVRQWWPRCEAAFVIWQAAP